jgi:hypothetical protein
MLILESIAKEILLDSCKKKAALMESSIATSMSKFIKEEATYEQLLNLAFNPKRDEQYISAPMLEATVWFRILEELSYMGGGVHPVELIEGSMKRKKPFKNKIKESDLSTIAGKMNLLGGVLGVNPRNSLKEAKSEFVRGSLAVLKEAYVQEIKGSNTLIQTVKGLRVPSNLVSRLESLFKSAGIANPISGKDMSKPMNFIKGVGIYIRNAKTAPLLGKISGIISSMKTSAIESLKKAAGRMAELFTKFKNSVINIKRSAEPYAKDAMTYAKVRVPEITKNVYNLAKTNFTKALNKVAGGASAAGTAIKGAASSAKDLGGRTAMAVGIATKGLGKKIAGGAAVATAAAAGLAKWATDSANAAKWSKIKNYAGWVAAGVGALAAARFVWKYFIAKNAKSAAGKGAAGVNALKTRANAEAKKALSAAMGKCKTDACKSNYKTAMAKFK